MAELSIPWAGTTIGDAGPYSDDDWQKVWETVFELFPGTINNYPQWGGLTITSAPAWSVTVGIGRAFMTGSFYENTAAIGHVAAPGTTKVVVYLEKVWATQVVRIKFADEPPPFVPTQTTGILWQAIIGEATFDGVGTPIAISQTVQHFVNTQFTGAVAGSQLLRVKYLQNDGTLDWQSEGTTDQLITSRLTIMVGHRVVSLAAGILKGQVTITLPEPYAVGGGGFQYMVFTTNVGVLPAVLPAGDTGPGAYPTTVTASTFTIDVVRDSTSSAAAPQIVTVNWMSIGRLGGADPD